MDLAGGLGADAGVGEGVEVGDGELGELHRGDRVRRDVAADDALVVLEGLGGEAAAVVVEPAGDELFDGGGGAGEVAAAGLGDERGEFPLGVAFPAAEGAGDLAAAAGARVGAGVDDEAPRAGPPLADRASHEPNRTEGVRRDPAVS